MSLILSNGTVLPDIPEAIVGRYPYLVITKIYNVPEEISTATYWLYGFSRQPVYVSAELLGSGMGRIRPDNFARCVYAIFNPTVSLEWTVSEETEDGIFSGQVGEETVGSYVLRYEIVYSNSDIFAAVALNSDMSVTYGDEVYYPESVLFDASAIQRTTLKNIANAIRSKTGKTAKIPVPNMAAEIGGISTMGEMQEKTVAPTTEEQVITADSGYDGMSKVTVAAAPLEEITVAHEFIQNTGTEYQVIEPSDGQYGIGKVNVPKVKLAYMIESEMSSDKEKTFTFKPPEGYDGIGTASVTVTYTGAPTLQGKTVTPTTAAQTVTADSGYEGLSSVVVQAAPTETLNVTPTTAEQTFTPSSGKVGFSQVTVAAAEDPVYQEKTVTPTTEEQVITADEGYDALSKVTVKAAESGGGVEYQSVMEVSF